MEHNESDELIEQLEEENSRLQSKIERLEGNAFSDFKNILEDVDLEVVELAENITGAALSATDLFFLGKLLGSYGPKRVKMALVNSKFKPEPLRYAYVLCIRGKYGKPKAKEQTRETKYNRIDDTYNPWGE